ncbi:hypothetical protein [Bacillus sp. NEB1478]|uniref:hypothetical protein n=1 Tax=Bacillus sp. NEB1478 TaxID=3073816 RepID=UPI00287341FF|nr:hypothetical protein [Bacillus sp. NEB1478]WNB92535.1 hypothetical protein RGB74_02390 [Bacillus sp. NEB1478]
MKKYLLASILFLVFILSGCGDDPVQEDLLHYVNKEAPKLAKEEGKAVGAYSSVTGTNYTDDLTMYNVLLDEVIPQYNEFIDDLESVDVKTDELRKIHENYIEAANIQASAFLTLVTALENQDSALVNEANEKLNTARTMLRDYQQDIKKLAKEHDVELNKK